MTRKLARLAALVPLAAAASVAVWPVGGVGAVEPDKTGYWVQPQTTQAPAAFPAPPTIPDGGLYVANGPDGPKAVSAVEFTIDGPLSAQLLLRVHSLVTPQTIPSPPDGLPLPPADAPPPPSPDPALAHIVVCAAHGDWDVPLPGQPGAWETKPAYDSDRCTLGQFSVDGTTLTFFLVPDRQNVDGIYNLVIIPDPTLKNEANTPFSVTFERPGHEAMHVDEPIGDVTPEDPPVDFGTQPPPVDDGALTAPFVAPFSNTTTPTFSVPTTPTTVAKPKRPRVNLPPAGAVPAVAVPGDGRGERTMAVGLLGLLGLAWWWVGGQVSRGPQLLGSLAGDDRRTKRDTEPTGGIGRFARPRRGRPRPLI
jgi:hypothetical protein